MSSSGEFQAARSLPEEGQSQEVDRVIHEPSRLRILGALNKVEEADFKYLETISKLQKSNLSMQTAKLEQAGYITIRKYIKGKFAATSYSITPAGRTALETYKQRINAMIEGEQHQLGEQYQRKTAGGQGSPNPQPGIP